MKRSIICILLTLCLSLSVCLPASAAEDSQYLPRESTMGDINLDGSVNAKDLLALRRYLADYEQQICFENTDLAGDCVINAKDVLALRQQLADFPTESASRFAAEDTDITAQLEDLGINNASFYSDSAGTASIIARNPYDMCAFDGKVFVSGGEYSDNMGPVNINYYTRTSTRHKMTSQLQTEKVDNFQIFNNTLFTVAIDPTTWTIGEYYIFNNSRERWDTQPNLPANIHCYDMAYYNGSYFFGGSNVYYDSRGETSRGTVTRCDESAIASYNKASFHDIPFYGKNGEQIANSATAVPRVYKLLEFKGELYAYCFSSAAYHNYSTATENDHNSLGLFRYNEQLDCFEYCTDKDYLTPFTTPVVKNSHINNEEVGTKHDFSWGDKYVMINQGVYTTTDLSEYTAVQIDGYPDLCIMDSIIINDRVYLMGTKWVANGEWINVVLETQDFESFRPILHYTSESFTRSFEYTDGAFFFGLGTTRELAMAGLGTACGQLYRYCYYK